MLIKANELIYTETDIIKAESEKAIVSQSVLRTHNVNLLNSEDAMISYLSGDIKSIYEQIEEYVQSKMELLCDLIEDVANNSTSYASKAEKIDAEAAGMIKKGGMIL